MKFKIIGFSLPDRFPTVFIVARRRQSKQR